MYTRGIYVNKLYFSLVDLLLQRGQLRTQKGRRKMISPSLLEGTVPGHEMC